MADYDRFRSFAERYIIERASTFRTGYEREEAWTATLDAKTIYGNIARAAQDAEPEIDISLPGALGGAGMIGQQAQRNPGPYNPPAAPRQPMQKTQPPAAPSRWGNLWQKGRTV